MGPLRPRFVNPPRHFLDHGVNGLVALASEPNTIHRPVKPALLEPMLRFPLAIWLQKTHMLMCECFTCSHGLGKLSG